MGDGVEKDVVEGAFEGEVVRPAVWKEAASA